MQHYPSNPPYILPPSVQLNNRQSLNDLCAKLDTLTTQHHQHFETLHNQLNALSDKVDNVISDTPRYTPHESSTSSVLGDAAVSTLCPTAPAMPARSVSKPSASLVDIGGYFSPDHKYDQHSDHQYISHVSVFVARVNRVLRTKSISNIEAFLKDSALRWFNIGLCLDGSHVFDDESGNMNIAKFYSALPDHGDQSRFEPSSRSVLLDMYILPALESRRLKTSLDQTDASVNNALRQAVKLHNRDHKALSVDPNIIGDEDLSVEVARLRHRDLENRREHDALTMRQPPQVSKAIKTLFDYPNKECAGCADTQERPVFPPGRKLDHKQLATILKEPQNTDNKKRPFNSVVGKPETTSLKVPLPTLCRVDDLLEDDDHYSYDDLDYTTTPAQHNQRDNTPPTTSSPRSSNYLLPRVTDASPENDMINSAYFTSDLVDKPEPSAPETPKDDRKRSTFWARRRAAAGKAKNG
ncbi:hypothetical protein E4T39_07219 [Aureobasidium subglaciale]|nr:hypothetical protein E4T39_07219 [Aureobasidium subglaciale]